MTDLGDVPGDALEDIAYLARSENRVEVLDALTSGPCSVRELRERTGTAKTTLNRILSELEERDWARRDADGEYAATPQGEHVAVQFAPLVGSMDTIRDLGEEIQVIPPAELSFAGTEVFSLQEFHDVDIYRTTSAQPDRLYEVWLDLVRASDTLQMLTAVGATEAADAVIHEEIVSEGMEMTVICSESVVELLLDPDRGYATPADILERHECGQRLYRYTGAIPSNVCVFDETVWVSNTGLETAIETRNDTVRTWALELFDRYLGDAALVTPGEMEIGD